jgi:predicted aspartyl protease
MKSVAFSVLCACVLLFQQVCGAQVLTSTTRPDAIASLPFELREGFLIVVDGQIGGIVHLKFILDTGASHTVISRKIANRLSLEREPGSVIDFQRKVPVEWARFPEVQVGPIVATDTRMMVGDLAQYSEFAHDVDAIIGLDLLTRCARIQIDYETRVVRFEKREIRPESGPSDIRRSESNGLAITVTVQNQPMHLLIDTGFQGIALFQRRLQNRVQRLDVKDRTVAQVGPLVGEEVRLPGLRVGHEGANPRVFLIRGETEAVPTAIDGYLGPRALHAKRIEIDFASMMFRWQ